MTVTDASLPSDSPFHLTTSDPFFKQAVPGLKNYPNMDLEITTSLYNLSNVQLTAADGEYKAHFCYYCVSTLLNEASTNR